MKVDQNIPRNHGRTLAGQTAALVARDVGETLLCKAVFAFAECGADGKWGFLGSLRCIGNIVGMILGYVQG